MTDEPNDITLLMSLDPLEYTKHDIEVIIAYHRNQRADREKGIKPKKDSGPKATLDLVKLGLTLATPKINRRV